MIREGIESLLLKGNPNIKTTVINSIDDLNIYGFRGDFDFVIVNPNQIINRIKQFKNLKSAHPEVRWFGLVYTILDKEILGIFDDIISIDDTKEGIQKKIQKHLKRKDVPGENKNSGGLTDRETDILKEIVKGRSNKEIADVLNISIHTVMSHRKNLVQKTKIKSQAGLTVYALTNDIISIDSL